MAESKVPETDKIANVLGAMYGYHTYQNPENFNTKKHFNAIISIHIHVYKINIHKETGTSLPLYTLTLFH